MNRGLLILLLAVLPAAAVSRAAEVIPPVPQRHFSDYAGVVSPAVAQRLDRKLARFEEETSNQILVAIYPTMQSDSSIDDYTVRVAHAWGVGGKKLDNGAVLFVFPKDRKMYMQVGYGLEGALPDALAKNIIEDEIKPRFQAGDFEGGLTAGVDAMLAATKGEYKGSPRRGQQLTLAHIVLIVIAVIVIVSIIRAMHRGPITYTRRGRFGGGWGPIIFAPPSGGWGGRGGFGGGGGGFSAGGGGFGGGGAGGSW